DAFAKHPQTPDKIAAVLWAIETTHDEGTMLSFVLQLLGVEPVWDAQGLVKQLKLVPPEQLGRQRIDVIVTTSGLFRDLFSQLLLLTDGAFRRALAASYASILAKNPALQPSLDAAMRDVPPSDQGDEKLEMNAVARHWIATAEAA